ncbi:MAG: hypothetical protein WDN06_17310 [Asticcacaulis sp.]
MAKLADLGFRFSIDKVNSIDFDLQDLHRSDVRYVKIGANLLLEQLLDIEGKPALKFLKDIHAGDYAGLLARYGIEVIAEKVENESRWSISSISRSATARATCSANRAPSRSRCWPKPTRRRALSNRPCRSKGGERSALYKMLFVLVIRILARAQFQVLPERLASSINSAASSPLYHQETSKVLEI